MMSSEINLGSRGVHRRCWTCCMEPFYAFFFFFLFDFKIGPQLFNVVFVMLHKCLV